MDEISRDLANIALEWNQKLVPIISGLPEGADDTTINAFVNGLDGANMWADGDSAVDVQGGRYYNTIRARPNTVKEQFEAVYSHFASELITVQANIINTSGLTEESKAAIGARMFDSSAVSSVTSLDGVSITNTQNIVQISQDLYGDDAELNGDGNAILTRSLKQMVGALLAIHNGAWHDDSTLSHAGMVSLDQDSVTSSHPGNDLYTGSPTHLRNDLDRVRNEIKELRGTAGWQSENSELYASGAKSLEALLTSTQGGGTKTATNPWGYNYDDIDGLLAILNATNTFTGQTTLTDDSPSYGSPTFISNGEDLVTAMSGVDAVLASHSGVVVGHTTQIDAFEIFVGQDSNIETTPNYSSTVFVQQGSSLRDAISRIDDVLDSGLQGGNLDSIADFVGQDNPGDTEPVYSSTNFITDGLNLKGTIGELDAALTTVSGLATEGNRTFASVLVSGVVTGDPPTASIENVSVAASGHIVVTSGDFRVLNSGAGVVMYSPSGARFRIQVDDTGSLLTTAF
jgi:hypothetical protein